MQQAGRSWGLAASLDVGLGESTEGKGKEEPPRHSVLLREPKPWRDKPNIAHWLLHPSRRKTSPAPAGARARGEGGRRGRALQQPCATWKCWRPCWAVLGVSSKAGVGAGSVPWVAGSWPPHRPAFLRAGKPSHASCSIPPPRAVPAAPLDVTLEHSSSCFLGQEQSDARRIWSSAWV